ncbi:bifunctional precorrin-2 dehydrogenase/sirohydrochlorin ferrochelatase [Natronomonas sp. CBA1123]|jgi:precorrin-2 dehydrogenase/sirohydrochlorin ferrochelatase|uniref:precorrin-2 dehydrogenase/sirohydrochlorin ferrochelatase family protein n=1 Tax=Natronomonas sp. CBA1123 TaxID=2668070 RepID=UPI0012EA4637|nr:bifunctional precorrin-2 dehydrogenase/sirohydrochlorin ferrochelatase [Natronomonas sp. CBA1123]MUV87185.1 bifunctional precorrin-2 dehydrogenase/sirohydrochlorin ferrochelatase [Natronomonas sp. CBA1123]
MIPLYHDFTDETVLVVGGGPVGARKARRFAREARVVVVSPEFPADDYGGAEHVRAAPTAEDVSAWVDRVDPALVVAATDDEAVNDAVEAAARERSVLLNRADRSGDRDVGSVVVPATVRDGDVVVSISTSGASPALSKELRTRIQSDIDGAGELARLTGEVREELKQRGIDASARRDAVRAVVQSPRVWKVLGTGGAKPRRTVDAVVESALGDKE